MLTYAKKKYNKLARAVTHNGYLAGFKHGYQAR